MKKERRFVPVDDIEVRVSGDGRKIEGLVTPFNKWTNIGGMFRERIMPGAFTDTIANDDIRALFNHDPNLVLGRTTNGSYRLSEEKRGLFGSISPPGTQVANDVVTLVDGEFVTGQSFGFIVKEDKWQTKEIDGVPTEHRTITGVQMFDGGPVTFPQYKETDAVMRSAEDVYEARMADINEEPSETVVDDEGEDDATRVARESQSRQRKLALLSHK